MRMAGEMLRAHDLAGHEGVFCVLYTEYKAPLLTIPMALMRLSSAPDLVERVYESLLASIADGTLAPGARLTQEELAERLDVSRQPVLQALRLLKQDGFVVDTGKRGVMVTPIDAHLIAQVYQLRAALDTLAAGLAARRTAHIDPALVQQGRKAARGRNVDAMVQADIAFHNAVYEASGNAMIAQSANRHWAHIRRAMGAVLQSAALRERVWDEHERIAHAIRAGDAARAESLTRAHGEHASHAVTQSLQAAAAA
jgi:DNA-binding GntR family transcriptional regulator